MGQESTSKLELNPPEEKMNTSKGSFIRWLIGILKDDLQSIVVNGESLRCFSNLPPDVCGVLSRRSDEGLLHLDILEEVLFSSRHKPLDILVKEFVKLYDRSGISFVTDVASDLPRVLSSNELLLDLLTSAVNKIITNLHFFGTLKISARECRSVEERLLGLQSCHLLLSVEAVDSEAPKIEVVKPLLSSSEASTRSVLHLFFRGRNLFLAFIPTIESNKMDNVFIHPSSLWGTEKILVIDPDSSLLLALRNSLARWGYHVATAECGELALMELENESFDVLVINFDVLGMPASSVLDRVVESNPETKVVAIGGDSAESFSHVSAVMNKPFKTNTLLKTIRKLSGIWGGGGVNEELSDDLLFCLGARNVLGGL